ncbi:acyltransferase [Nocardioides salarius]|uniref:acyltransferase n=1 Tax=Nocardioides salarius TaxID=374513 RepID=UPI00187AFFA3
MTHKPRKIASKAVQALRAYDLGRKGVTLGERSRVHGNVIAYLYPGSNVEIGANATLVAQTSRNSLEARGPIILRTNSSSARIYIGDDTGITSSTISASSQITIGKRVLIGGGVIITDSDHHIIDAAPASRRRYAGPEEPQVRDAIHIEDDAFVGARTIVLKGVRIGKGSVIGAGSVVVSDIPQHSLAAGNPCKVIRGLR